MAVDLSSGQSAVTTDQYGVTHLVWVENNTLYHATYDTNSETWDNATVIANIGNQNVQNIHIVTNSGLINNGPTGAPGIAVVYQQGTDSNSNFYYTAAQYDQNQNLQWLNSPVALTQDQVGDLNPTVQIYQPTNSTPGSISNNTASVVVLGEKVNVQNPPSFNTQSNQTATTPQEGTNIYGQTFTVNSNQFTTPSTTTPIANYAPENNLVQNGVVQGLTTFTTSAATPSVATNAATPTFTTNAATPQTSGYQGSANQWNTSLFYSTNLGNQFEFALPPTGFLNGVWGLSKGFFMQGAIRGAGTYQDTGLVLQTAARGVYQLGGGSGRWRDDLKVTEKTIDQESSAAFRVSLFGSTIYKYASPGSLIPTSETNIVGASLGALIPIAIPFPYGAIARLSFSGSLGLAASFSGNPNPNSAEPLVGPVLGLIGAGVATVASVMIFGGAFAGGRETAAYTIAAATLGGIVGFIADESAYSNVNTSVYVPNFYGTFNGRVGENWLNANARVGLFTTFGIDLTTGATNAYLSFPMYIGIGVGAIQAGFSFNPSFSFPITQANSSTSSVTTNAANAVAAYTSTTNPSLGTATVSGAILTIDLGTTLNAQDIPASGNFSVTEITAQGNTNTYQVSNVLIQGSKVILQLVQPIVVSSNTSYTSINSTTPTISANSIQVAYTGTTLQDNQGNQIANFADSVTNNSPQTLTYTYNPLNGNSENYANSTDLIGAGLYFGSGSGTTNQVILVFNQNISGSPTNAQFSIQSNGVTYSVISYTITNNTLTLTTSSPIVVRDAVTLNYTGNALIGTNNNAILPFTNYNVQTASTLTAISATITGTDTISLVLNQALTSTPPASGFSVQGNNTNYTVSSTKYTGKILTLTTSSSILAGSSVTVSATGYLQVPVSTPVVTTSILPNVEAALGQDSTPSLAPTSAGNQLLAAWISDAPPLTPIAGFVQGNQILLNFIENFNTAITLQKEQFTVTVNGTVISNDVSNAQFKYSNGILLTLNNSVAATDTVTVSYALNTTNSTDNPYLTDAEGTKLWVPAFTTSLANSTGNSITQSPELLGSGSIVQSDGTNLITLVFNQILKGTPLSNQFTVTVNGQSYSVGSNVTVSGNTVQLTVTPPTGDNLIGQSSLVRVGYSNSSTPDDNLTAESGGAAVAQFSNYAVQTAASTPTTVVKYGFGPVGNSFLSTANIIPGTNGLNFHAVAGLDPSSGDNVIVWINADTSQIQSNLTPGEIYSNNQSQLINNSLQSSSIYYSIDSGTNNTWTVATPIALNQTGSNSQVTLGTGPNNQLMAAWINTQVNSTNNTSTSTIYYSLLSGGTWSTPQVVLSGVTPDPVTDLVISNVGGQPAIFATETQPASYNELTTGESPLIYFSLDEPNGSTTANNGGALGAAVQGTYNGTVQSDANGALWNTTTHQGDPDPAATFSNGASLTSNGLAISGNSFSLDFWFNVPNLTQGTINLAQLSGLFSLSLTSAGILDLNIAGGDLTSSTVSANKWNYVAVTYSGQTKTASLYLNGQLAATQSNLTLTAPTSTNLTLAGIAGTTVSLDEVAIYNSVLSYSNSPTNLNQINLSTITAAQLQEGLLGSNDIGTKYAAQYNALIPSGPDTQYAVWNGNSWSSTPNRIQPLTQPVATSLNDATNPLWDIVSSISNNSNGYITPNGQPDLEFNITLTGEQNSQITGISITSGNQSWAVGTNGTSALSGEQLGVVQATKLLNPLNPNASSTFSHWVLGQTENYELFVDSGNSAPITGATITVYYADGSSTPFTNQNSIASDAEVSNITTGEVIGTATVQENNDQSLANIDSGFIVSTNNSMIGYVMASGTNNNTNYVAVGNRGYTDLSGTVLNGGTVQVLFNSGEVLTNNETNPLTTTDLTGNPDGVLITGLTDAGIAYANSSISLATGNVLGDGGGDLIIGDANNNTVYIIKGSYLAANRGTTINVANLTSAQGYAITAPNTAGTNAAFGFSVAVGNFSGNSNLQDIAIGTPNQNSGEGAVYIYSYNGSSSSFSLVNTLKGSPSTQTSEAFGYALGVSHYAGPGTANTFNGSTGDILFVGAPNYQVTITNTWNGINGFSGSGQAVFPTTSISTAGAVYGYFTNNNTLDTTADLTFVGPSTPSSVTGTAGNDLVGSSITSADYNGDGTQDLAIGAPSGNAGNGQVYVLKGGSNWTTNTSKQDLASVSDLIIDQSLANASIGTLVTSPGDLNSDGIQELLITAPQAANATGQSYLLFGGTGGLDLQQTGQVVDLNPTANANKTDLLLNGSQPFQLAGTAAVGAGTVNGNPSLIISAPNANQLYTVYGHPWLADDGSLKLSNISGDNGFVIDGSTNTPNLVGNGSNVVMLGDINGDGFADLASGGSPDGLLIVFGNSTKNLTSPTATQSLQVTIQNAQIQQVVSMGDFNGDGLQDFGVLDTDGNLYGVLGRPNLSSLGTLTLSTTSNQYVSTTDTKVTGNVGDVNGDGYDDFLFKYDLYFGNAEGILNNASTDYIGLNEPGAQGIGDINGDGYADLGVGTPNVNYGQGEFTITTGPHITSSTNQTTVTAPNNPAATGEIDSSWPTSYGDGGGSTLIRPALVSNDQGTLLRVYNNKQNLYVQTTTNPYGGTNDVWGNSTEINPSIKTNSSVSLAFYQGMYWLAYTGTTGNLDLANSIDGINWSDSYIVNGNTSLAGPTLVVYNDQLYIFFLKNDFENPEILYTYSSDPANSTTWSTTIGTSNATLSNVGAAVLPDPNLNGPGTLVVAYQHENSTSFSVMTSTNPAEESSTWASNTVSGHSTNVGPGLAQLNGTLYLTYSNNDLLTSNDGVNWGNYQSVPTDTYQTPTPVIYHGQLYIGLAGTEGGLDMVGSNFIANNMALGSDLKAIGDFNGDGISDLAVLAPNYVNLQVESPSFNGQGGVFIYYGTSNGIASNATPDVVLVDASGAPIITKISAAGDINGDGYDDLLAAAPNAAISSNANSGAVNVVFGGNQWSQYNLNNPYNLGNLSSNPTQGFQITGLPGSQAGISMSGGADVNGDGLSDIIIGAPGNNDNLTYTIFGSDFNSTINQVGTLGDDVMVGTPTGESFVGGEGDDQIYTNGGQDVVNAGPGDDLVTVWDTTFRRLDGGTGTNTLEFEGYNGENWNLTTLSPGIRLKNFEILDITAYGSNTLTLNSLTVTKLSSDNIVAVLMDPTDTLNLSADFSSTGTVYQSGQTLYKYTSSTSAATVLVAESNSTVSPTVTFTAAATNTPAPILPNSTPAAVSNLTTQVITPTASNSSNQTTTEAFSSSNQPAKIYISNPFASKANGEVNFTIQRTGDLTQYLGVDYITSDKSGKAGKDYYPAFGELVFTPNETSKTVTVNLPPNETFTGLKKFQLTAQIVRESSTSVQPFQVELTNTNGSQIRYLTNQSSPTVPLPSDPINSITAPIGEEDFYLTANQQGTASLTFGITGAPAVNSIYVSNNQGQWQNFFFDGQTGAKFTTNPNGTKEVQLNFQDGGRGDADSSNNGIINVKMAITNSSLTPVVGTPLKDTLIGTGTASQLIGITGGDILTGSAGVANEFYYTSLKDVGSTITNFQPNTDKLNLRELLNSIGYQGSNVIADHYVGFKQLSTGTFVTIDSDGLGTASVPRPFLFVKGVTETQLNNTNNFVF